MSGSHIPPALKIFAMRAVDENLLTTEDCVALGAFCPRTGRRLREEWLANGGALEPHQPPNSLPSARSMYPVLGESICFLVDRQRDVYLDELQSNLITLGHPRLGLSTICRHLKKLGYSRKSTNCYAYTRDDERRLEYIKCIAHYEPEQLVFMDESSFESRTHNRTHARAPRGTGAYSEQHSRRGKRYSIMSACSLKQQVFAIHAQKGSFTGEAFYDYVVETLLLAMNPYPGPDSVLVCANASIHENDDIRELVDAFGCKLVCLPPSSPDYNPILKCFDQMKKYIARHGRDEDGLVVQVLEAANTVTRSDIEGYYRLSGLL